MYRENKKTKYAIRKLAVATVSLAIGATVAPAIAGTSQVAHAEESTQSNPVKKNKVRYEFYNATPEKELPEGLMKLLPVDDRDYAVGDLIVPKHLNMPIYEDKENNGVWTFEPAVILSYNEDKSFPYEGKEVVFSGAWEFTPNEESTQSNPVKKNKVRYEFYNATPEKELPEGLMKLLPVDDKDYAVGDLIVPKHLNMPIYEDKVNNGRWLFEPAVILSYNEDKSFPYEGKEVVFSGSWEFEPNPASTYSFVSVTPGRELPSYISELLPEDDTVYKEGDVVKAKNPAQTITQFDPVNNEDWHFVGYDKESGVAGEDDLKFIGKWRSEAHPVVWSSDYADMPSIDKIGVGATKVTGTGVAGAAVRVTLPDGTKKTVPVDSNGKWELTLKKPLNHEEEVTAFQIENEKKFSWSTSERAKTDADRTQIYYPEVTKVENPGQLSQEEKEHVKTVVETNNTLLPGTTVDVADNGDVTITYPDNSVSTLSKENIIEKRTTADKTTPNKPEKTVVADADQLTRDEKDQVAIEIGKANPDLPAGTSVTVADNGDVTITYPDGSENIVESEHTVVKKTVAGEQEPNKPELTEVANPEKLTQDEKDQVAIEVGKANPELLGDISVTVADNGDVTITYLDGSVDTISGKNTVKEKGQPAQPTQPSQPIPTPVPGKQQTIAEETTPKAIEVIEVGATTKLTQEEKGKVEEAVKKANPTFPAGTKVTVAGNGDVTITYPDGSVDTISGENTVKEKVKPAGEKAKAKTLPNTGLTANNAVVAGLSILAMAALLAARRKNNK